MIQSVLLRPLPCDTLPQCRPTGTWPHEASEIISQNKSPFFQVPGILLPQRKISEHKLPLCLRIRTWNCKMAAERPSAEDLRGRTDSQGLPILSPLPWLSCHAPQGTPGHRPCFLQVAVSPRMKGPRSASCLTMVSQNPTTLSRWFFLRQIDDKPSAVVLGRVVHPTDPNSRTI